jgi:hypothetical protein
MDTDAHLRWLEAQIVAGELRIAQTQNRLDWRRCARMGHAGQRGDLGGDAGRAGAAAGSAPTAAGLAVAGGLSGAITYSGT